MTSALRFCPKCGAQIPPDAPEGGCPGCLLETGLGLLLDRPPGGNPSAIASAKGDHGVSAENVEANAVTAARRSKKAARAAEILGELGDYELVEEVGRGGQGVVFRARQKSLNRTVALKVISLGQWASKAHLKRFRREAEAAASLDHPGIVPIYEVGERDGSCYFSMKFIEGGQLDEVVKRAPMSVRRTAELIAKVARTVHHAHEHGILHRDIKPGNILLDRKGEPNLTDFGLARLVETQSTMTRTLEVIGTPSYMAPEQAVGNNAAVSSVTDVYGVGAVLYQLLTGQPPFAGGSTYETIKLLLETEPRQPRLLNPKIDRDLSTICLKCLEKEAKRRYSSALALAEDLERWLKHEPIQARHTGVFARGRKWVRRNPTSALLGASLLALAAAFVWNVWKGELIHRPVTNGIAVLPFENLSADADNAYFAEGIHEEILTRLASIAGLKVISGTSTQQYQSKPRNLRDIAKQLGVANIVEGSVQKAADQVRVNVQLINAQTDSHLWAETYDRKLTDIFGVESEVARGITAALQTKLTGREGQALAVKPTNNPEAYDAYLRGLAFEARTIRQEHLRTEAIGFYERAVQLDPNFALAWARLSRAQAFLYSQEEPTSTTRRSRRDAAKSALENAQRLEPNSPETLLVLGYYQYWVLGDDGLAKTTFKELSKLLPGNSEIPAALGHVTEAEGHLDQSIAYFEQGLALDPRNMDLLVGAAETYAGLRQFPVAIKLYDRALDVIPNDPELMAFKATMYRAEGNLQESAKLLIDVNERTTSPIAFEQKINQLRLERNHAEAIRLLRARRAQPPSAFETEFGTFPPAEALRILYMCHLAFAQRLVGDMAGAKVTAEQLRNTMESDCKEQPDNPANVVLLALADAVLGERDSALREAERAYMLSRRPEYGAAGPPYDDILALIQTVLGENSRAISTLKHLLQTSYKSDFYDTPVTPALLRLDPFWDPLRADPAFQKLCEEKHK
jgi:TolB-like protein/Tfp pilus assembly protein PilF/predicted Ser/Thr protein kinase